MYWSAYVSTIHYFHITITPIITSKILHNQCLQFLMGRLWYSGENGKNGCAKLWAGGKQVVLWERWNSQYHHLQKTSGGLFKTCSAWDLFVLASIMYLYLLMCARNDYSLNEYLSLNKTIYTLHGLSIITTFFWSL